jgi:hypothetical protein
MQGFPETCKLFQGFLQGKKIEKVCCTGYKVQTHWAHYCTFSQHLTFQQTQQMRTASTYFQVLVLYLLSPPLVSNNEYNLSGNF